MVSNEERRRMGCAVRDILVEQFRLLHVMVGIQELRRLLTTIFASLMRLKHFSLLLEYNLSNQPSNYTTASPGRTSTTVILEPSTGAFDPIHHTTLIYENTNRLNHMGSDYFSLVNPWYHAPTIPGLTGFHGIFLFTCLNEIDPMGSTNYGKLTNISIVPTASPAAKVGAAGTGPAGSGQNFPQTFEFIVTALNNNIIRMKNIFLVSFVVPRSLRWCC